MLSFLVVLYDKIQMHTVSLVSCTVEVGPVVQAAAGRTTRLPANAYQHAKCEISMLQPALSTRTQSGQSLRQTVST